MKRLFDMLGSAALLLVLSPVFVVTALLVRQKLGSPVFFTQTRIGKGERPFTIYKFRTMRDGTGSDEERLTDFGKFLRTTSLDELPELWNVLKGDMSFVGPRPLLPEYLPFYSQTEKMRHAVRPGITGLAQVNGRNAIGWNEKLAHDVNYVQHRSLKMDLWILWRTLRTVIAREGISAEGQATYVRLDVARGGQA